MQPCHNRVDGDFRAHCELYDALFQTDLDDREIFEDVAG
jgi:hypothetical protein